MLEMYISANHEYAEKSPFFMSGSIFKMSILS